MAERVARTSGALPVMVSSENGRAGMSAAMALLCQGGRALDAVELACRVVEDDPEDHSVGYGGMPNALGEVELDASIMDGRTLQTGAVAAVKGYANPITLARRVMEELPHVLLAGRGAERFAAELGHLRADQRTEEALRRWRERFDEHGLTPGSSDSLRSLARKLAVPMQLRDQATQPAQPLAPAETERAAKDDTLGTVNFLARDRYGDLASAVSTSGVAWKYPSRVGDSPIVGAGNYCDNRYGAVACTGRGELAIRMGTARSMILYLKMGMSLLDAGLEALRDLAYLEPTPGHWMNMVALAPKGEETEIAGFATVSGRYYLYMTAEMDAPQLAERTCLPEQA